MKIRILTGAMALFLFAGSAWAFRGADARPGGRLLGGAYSNFLTGYMEYRDGNLDGALEAYTKALRFAEGEPDILYEIANVLVKKGKLPEAQGYLEKALASDETHTRSRYLL